MLKIPSGISHFPDMPLDNYYYVDRTNYIEMLEQRAKKTVMFLRPRRFGKSLFVSMLHYYYGMEHKVKFKDVFGKYYIGQNPTPSANNYLILNLDFSAIDTSSNKTTYRDFMDNVQQSCIRLLGAYRQFFDIEDVKAIREKDSPQGMLKELLTIVDFKANGQKIYVLIDEYDQFANELLAFNSNEFKRIVSRNGWVRRFYEVLKIASKQGSIERIFMTGISPITLDNLTTGFNIVTSYTTELNFHNMMGFTEAEVLNILKKVQVPDEDLDKVLEDLRFWYNGYSFEEQAHQSIYNPEMVLYFADYYNVYKKYPKKLLHDNIASDYGKIRQLFKINDTKRTNDRILREVVLEGKVAATLVSKYSFERPWTDDDFVSLLFYSGILTMKRDILGQTIFAIPNYVIRQLYFQFFYQLTIDKTKLGPQQLNLKDKVEELANHNELQALITLTENIISQLGREDKAHFNETSLKGLIASYFYQVPYYNLFSELEVKKANNKKGRVDILLTRRAPFEPRFQFVFELKYLRAKQRASFKDTKKEAIDQLKEYLDNDTTLQKLDKLKAYVVVFVDNEGHFFVVN